MAGFAPAPSPAPAEGGGTGATQVDLIIDNHGDPTAVTYYTNQGGRGVVDTTTLSAGLVLASGSHGHHYVTTGDEDGIGDDAGQLPDGLYVSRGAEQNYDAAVFLVVWAGNASVLAPEVSVIGPGPGLVDLIALLDDPTTPTTTGMTIIHVDGTTETIDSSALPDGTTVLDVAPAQNIVYTLEFTGYLTNGTTAVPGFYTASAATDGVAAATTGGVLCAGVTVLVWAQNQSVAISPQVG